MQFHNFVIFYLHQSNGAFFVFPSSVCMIVENLGKLSFYKDGSYKIINLFFKKIYKQENSFEFRSPLILV